ncbi:MAG: hypothetical protein C5B59_13680 [Bacteroidetes bacterium]|nr:MAG: hypothetical protein C5B59_13680 [Bacteroidota bacterium]
MAVPKNGSNSWNLQSLIPEPCTRSFICGWTGAGKSTLLEVLLNGYNAYHPGHWLFIIDPKGRYLPVEAESDFEQNLFPDGYDSIVHGRRRVVPVIGSVMGKPRTPKEGEGVLVVRENSDALRFFDWLLEHSDVNHPSLVCMDESIEVMHGVQAHKSFRRITQMGRERGIGCIILNQRPTYIDGTWLSESQYVYCGTLIKANDIRRVIDNVKAPDAEEKLLSIENDHEFVQFDQKGRLARGPFKLRL